MSVSSTVFFTLLVTVISNCSASKTNKLVSVLRMDADGEKLIQMGTSFNNSMLKLIGHSFVNLEETVVQEICQKNPCTLWSNWTDCTANGTNALGFQIRKRKCWYNSTDACDQGGPVTIETASKVCEGGQLQKLCINNTCSLWSNWTDCKANGTSAFTYKSHVRKCWYKRTNACVQDGPVTMETVSKVCKRWCRSDYTVSKHGFCIKYQTAQYSHPNAEKRCKSEGGHVMNVDTKDRWIDHEYITNGKGMFHVDGTKFSVHQAWAFQEGSDPTKNGVTKWKKGEPNYGRYDFCLYGETKGGKSYWWDSPCHHTLNSLCEIRI